MLGLESWGARGSGVVLCAVVLGCGPAVDTGGTGSSGGVVDSGEVSGDSSGDASRPGGTLTGADTAMTEPPDPATGPPPDEAEINGPYLIAFRTVIAAETPFQFTADVSVIDDVLDMRLVPLSLSPGSVDAPREALPEFALSFTDIELAADGTFMLELPETFLPAATNPITGSDVVADLAIVGWFNGRRMCGNLSGNIIEPAMIDLTGSSLAGIPMDDGVLPPVADALCG